MELSQLALWCAAPHMGSAYSTLAADVICRHQRMRGRQVTFITGTDEHGEKIAAAAAAAGLPPQQHCDSVAQQYAALWKKARCGLHRAWMQAQPPGGAGICGRASQAPCSAQAGAAAQMDIGEHRFVRTTSPAHKALVSEVLQKAHDRGDIYKASYSGRYCVGCESYKDDEEMGPGHTCPTHRTECQLRQEENYFFRLSRCRLLGGAELAQAAGPARHNSLATLHMQA